MNTPEAEFRNSGGLHLAGATTYGWQGVAYEPCTYQ
jgi:hypothetical protein